MVDWSLLALYLVPYYARQQSMNRLTVTKTKLFSSWKLGYPCSYSNYSFPTQPNPSPEDIFQLNPDASPSDIKKKYIELVKMYHPDTTTCRDAEVAEARFHAIHNAYNTILRRSGSFKGTRDDPVDTEADEIRKRLAAWKAAEAHRGASFYNQERRRRALEAENSAGKWWKSDRSIFYLLGGTTIAMILVQIQGHSVSTQRQKVKKYLELQKGSRSEQGDKP